MTPVVITSMAFTIAVPNVAFAVTMSCARRCLFRSRFLLTRTNLNSRSRRPTISAATYAGNRVTTGGSIGVRFANSTLISSALSITGDRNLFPPV